MKDSSKRRTALRNTTESTLKLMLALALFSVLFVAGCSDKDIVENNPATKTAPGAKLGIAGVTVSATGTGAVDPKNAVDGDPGTQWSSGGPAPQWIQLDLGKEETVSKVKLVVSQTPEGPTSHDVFGGLTGDQLKPIGRWEGVTKDGQEIEVEIPSQKVRYLRIVTTKSPSWIAWREIEIH